MKKFTLGALAICALSFQAAAQGSYLRVGAGYAFATATGTYPEYKGGSSSETIKARNYSFGKGLNGQIGLGFMLNDHVGLEIGVGYLKGLKSEFKDSETDGTITETYLSEHRANMLSLMPSVVFKGSAAGISPYARVGMLAGMVKGISSFKATGDSDSYELEMEEKGGVSLGLTAAIGVQFPLSDKIAFYAEGNFLQMAWSPKKGELTKARQNGIDMLPTIDSEDKKWEYVDEINYNYTSGSSSNEQLVEKRPMSNAGISLGLIVSF